MSETCTHPQLVEGYCSECGHCQHDVLLNGACMACGKSDLDVTIKPDAAPSNVVPLSKLVRKAKLAKE